MFEPVKDLGLRWRVFVIVVLAGLAIGVGEGDIAVGGAAGLLVCCLVGLAGISRPDPKDGPAGAGAGSRQGWGAWDSGAADPGDADTLPIPALDLAAVAALDCGVVVRYGP